ncbi:MAG: hypothetical protein VZS44_06835 [Bacilli bacterium]|nr:hypothetical protein [Bacilli bacterium]
MNKKKKVIILTFIVIVGILLLIFTINKYLLHHNIKLDEIKQFNIEMNGYSIGISSRKDVTKISSSSYETSFEIIDEDDHYRNLYKVNFANIELFDENKDDFIDDIERPEVLNVDGKRFEYYFNKSVGFDNYATIYYILPDKKGRLVIEVVGTSIYTFSGEQIKTMPKVDKDVMESEELAIILNFTINQ